MNSGRDVMVMEDYSLDVAVASTPRAVLWNALRQVDGRAVLVKTPEPGGRDRLTATRLREEFALGSRLASTALLRPVELIDDGESMAIVYESFAGAPVATTGGVDVATFLTIALQLAEGLRALHGEGLLHRDVHPGGILYDPLTRTAKFWDLSAADPIGSAAPLASTSLTYASPEDTGRTTQPVDVRSDLYALGATCYHLLAGAPPFPSADPLELIHHHLARLAEFPSAVRAAIPEPVLGIVLKLLAKSPGDRYQSAAGLVADLSFCRERLAAGEPLEPFSLGRRDVPARFDLPERLYGRDEQIDVLQRAWSRAAAGRTEVVLVSGLSGSGKSALVELLRERVAADDGFFVSGKFEQLTSSVPYGAIRQAFAQLVVQLLAESPPRIAAWREAILLSLGDQGQVIVDVLPEVEQLIGPQPPVTALGPVETQYRFARLFQQFVRVFTTDGRALALFLDDWQWADEASLHLIQALATAAPARALLLVGAYRHNEVSGEHGVTALIARLRESACPVTDIAVLPLAAADIAHLLREGLRFDAARADLLAREIHQRTDGNPFFVRASLRDLYDTHVLNVGADGAWEWDAEGLSRFPPAANVAALLVARIGRLSTDVQQLLQIAACLGGTFSASTLAVASASTDDAVTASIVAALDAHVLVRDRGQLRFLHDRVQEAAYSLIPHDREAALHLAIGRRLLAAATSDDEAARALPHLNAGRTLIDDAAERQRLARLNLEEGRRARRSTAYAAAAQHAAAGLELLGEQAWAEDYALTLDLYELRADSEYLAGRFEVAEQLYPVALAAARTDLDRIRVLNVQKDQYELQGRYLDAIRVLRQGLALVGIVLPEDERDIAVALEEELRATPVLLGGRRIDALVDAPPLDDPLRVATLRMLMGMWPSCYVAGLQSLLALVSVKIANFSLQYGNCEITSAAYVNYSFVAGFITGDYEQAYAFGRVGIALAERYANRSVHAWCCFLFGCGTLIWRAPLRDGRAYLEQAVRLGVESGNIASASYAASYIVTDAFYGGAPLDEVRALYDEYLPFLQRSNPAIHLFCQLGTQSLREHAELPPVDDRVLAQAVAGTPFFTAVYRFGKLMAAYMFGDVETAARLADEAVDDAPRLLAGTFKAADTWFYAALIAARTADATADAARTRHLLQRIDTARRQLEPLARSCPANFAHKLRLVEAELARLRGQRDAAALAYEEAAMTAGRHGFTQDEALSLELSARFWLAAGFHRRGASALADALDSYHRWGGSRYARVLSERFADIIAPYRGDAIGSRAAAYAKDERLDLLSVTKASQAISSEIDLDRLLARLMQIVMENAGATRAVLLLRDEAAGFAPAASASISSEPQVLPSGGTALPFAEVPGTLVDAVLRSGAPLIVDEAQQDGRFARDASAGGRRVRAAMCCPVRYKDAITGVLYLENELSAGVFTADRAAVLELLLGQLAISLENARLYSELRVSMAHAEDARAEAEQANRTKDEFLAMLGHELRNPLAPILTACELMRLKAPEQFRREREIIDRQLRHVTRLVDDLLDVSRIARGRIELRVEPLALSDVIVKAIEVVEPLLEERRVRLVTDVPADLTIVADPVRLRQVIANLLNNAAKFSTADATVEVRAAIEDADIVLTVRDEGIGIEPEILPRIFDMFVQAPQATDRTRGGLGLGLTIARSLVGMHGGVIRAHSDGTGHGARFEVRLPAPAAAMAARPVTTPLQGRIASRRILIVDDNQDAAQMLADVLQELGHVVLMAHDAAGALALLDTEAVDAALLDIGLPGIDGYELARRIRAMQTHRGISLIALTGYGRAGDRDRAFDAGFNAHLTKPIDVDALQETLDGTRLAE